MVEALRRHPSAWIDFMMRFELGLEQPDPRRALSSAVTIGGAYVAGGFVGNKPFAGPLPGGRSRAAGPFLPPPKTHRGAASNESGCRLISEGTTVRLTREGDVSGGRDAGGEYDPVDQGETWA